MKPFVTLFVMYTIILSWSTLSHSANSYNNNSTKTACSSFRSFVDTGYDLVSQNSSRLDEDPGSKPEMYK